MSVAPPDYRFLFRHLPGNYLLLAPDGTVLDHSDRHMAASMRTREFTAGRNIFEAFPSTPESQAELHSSHEEVRRTLQPHSMHLIRYDLERPAEQGGGVEERYWQLTHYPILADDGTLHYILQIPEDVTEQHLTQQRSRQLQADLNAEQERTRFILESLPVMIATLRPDGSAKFFNQHWLQFTGRSLADSLGWNWLDDLHPDDREATRHGWEQALQGTDEYQVEYRLRQQDGQYRWFLVWAIPRLGDDGRPVMWVGAGIDIQDQKQMVQELLETNEQQAFLAEQSYQSYEQARTQRETLYNLFNQVPAPICILRGPTHLYEFVNKAYQALFPNRPLQGLPVAEALPELLDQGVLELLDNVYKTGTTFNGRAIPLAFDRGQGQLETRYFDFTYERFQQSQHQAGITVYAVDVTELLEAQQRTQRGPDAAPN